MGAECHPAKLQDTGISAGGRAFKQTLTTEPEGQGTGILKNIYKTKGIPYIWSCSYRWCLVFLLSFQFFNICPFCISWKSAQTLCPSAEWKLRAGLLPIQRPALCFCVNFEVCQAKLLKLQTDVWLSQAVTASEAETVTLSGTENLPV